jgi:Rieske Fe-S protein
VGSDLDAQGRVLCPCHISFFDVQTGQPNEGAPAKLPLPPISWALVDGAGKVVASRKAGQPIQGQPDAALLAQCSLYITKPGREAA